MKSTLEEKIKFHLLNIGRCNQFCRIIILPILAICMFFFNLVKYCKNNGKRFAMMVMTFLLFGVYSSFSFPIFISTIPDNDLMIEEVMSDIVLAEVSDLDINSVELLDDNELEAEFLETEHEFDDVDVYKADEILEFTDDNFADYNLKTDSFDFSIISPNEIPEYFDKDDWKLILVNKQHSIPENYTFELGNITDSMQCDERIIDDLRAMLKAAKNDGVDLEIRSPYRSLERQEYLFNKKITLYMRMGMSFAEAYRLSSEAVTIPGASEHQIGLALDITCANYYSLDEGFFETTAGKWLNDNSYKYGFIVRYPSGKEYITGIEYEPWHFRYVGAKAATVISLNDMCLEEFWEILDK